MKRVTSCALRDLLAATESVGNDQPVGGRFANSGEKLEFANGRGDFVLVVLEAERAGHAAASRSRSLEVDAHAAQERLFGGHLHDGLVMAVSVEQSLALELRKGRVSGVVFQELAEQKRLAGESLGALVVREEVDEFVAENGDAAGLEADD